MRSYFSGRGSLDKSMVSRASLRSRSRLSQSLTAGRSHTNRHACLLRSPDQLRDLGRPGTGLKPQAHQAQAFQTRLPSRTCDRHDSGNPSSDTASAAEQLSSAAQDLASPDGPLVRRRPLGPAAPFSKPRGVGRRTEGQALRQRRFRRFRFTSPSLEPKPRRAARPSRKTREIR